MSTLCHSEGWSMFFKVLWRIRRYFQVHYHDYLTRWKPQQVCQHHYHQWHFSQHYCPNHPWFQKKSVRQLWVKTITTFIHLMLKVLKKEVKLAGPLGWYWSPSLRTTPPWLWCLCWVQSPHFPDKDIWSRNSLPYTPTFPSPLFWSTRRLLPGDNCQFKL